MRQNFTNQPKKKNKNFIFKKKMEWRTRGVNIKKCIKCLFYRFGGKKQQTNKKNKENKLKKNILLADLV